MGNGSLSKRKPRLVQSPSCERNASVLTPPISVEPASLQESCGLLSADSDLASSREATPIYSDSARGPVAVSKEHLAHLSVTQAAVDHRLSATPDLSTASSQVRLKSGLSLSTTNPPPTDTSSGIGSLYAIMDLEGASGNFPKIGTTEAPSTAAVRLRLMLNQIEKGDMPSSADLKGCLGYAAAILENVCKTEQEMRNDEEGEDLPDVAGDVVPDQVRDWLASTFTRRSSSLTRRESGPALTLRGVVQAVRMHIKLNTAYKQVAGLQYPQAVSEFLQSVDDWSFDVFYFNRITESEPLRYMGFELFRKYDLISKFKISVNVLDSFLQQIEIGYNKHNNPYHNAIHAADVTQAMHSLLWQTGLKSWLSDVEVYACLLAAIIHDFEHTGTTNTFHVQNRSEMALVYNDKSVLENHHLCAAFRLMRQDDFNILSSLSNDEFSEMRALVVDMVLATDMSSHFHQLNAVKTMISGATGPENIDKTKGLSLCLHCCDIGHPTKEWNLHDAFADLIVEEFFLQGDREKELGLTCSPLCDRSTTLVPESQVGFIDFIVKPLFDILKDMLDVILPMQSDSQEMSDICEDAREGDDVSNVETQQKHNLWMETLTNNCLSNRDHWKDRCRPKDTIPPAEEKREEATPVRIEAVAQHSVADSSDGDAPIAGNAEASASKSENAKHVQSNVSQPPVVARHDSDLAKRRAAAAREGVGRPRLTGNPKSPPSKQRLGRQGSNPSIQSPSKQLSSSGGDR